MSPHSNTLPRPVNLVALKMVREKRIGYGLPIIRSDDAIALVRRIFKNSYREMVLVIGLDNQSRPTVVHTVALGSPDQAAVSISSVFKPLLLSNSSGFILVHNHPGGRMAASQADRDVTEMLKKIGEQLEINMIDHIILNADGSGFYSFKTQGVL